MLATRARRPPATRAGSPCRPRSAPSAHTADWASAASAAAFRARSALRGKKTWLRIVPQAMPTPISAARLSAARNTASGALTFGKAMIATV